MGFFLIVYVDLDYKWDCFFRVFSYWFGFKLKIRYEKNYKYTNININGWPTWYYKNLILVRENCLRKKNFTFKSLARLPGVSYKLVYLVLQNKLNNLSNSKK